MKNKLIIIFAVIVIGIVLVWLYTSFFKAAPAYIIDEGNSFTGGPVKLKAKTGTCDVCKYGNGVTEHRNVEYCSLCDAWICKDCQPNLALRAVAMVNRTFDPNHATFKPVN